MRRQVRQLVIDVMREEVGETFGAIEALEAEAFGLQVAEVLLDVESMLGPHP